MTLPSALLGQQPLSLRTKHRGARLDVCDQRAASSYGHGHRHGNVSGIANYGGEVHAKHITARQGYLTGLTHAAPLSGRPQIDRFSVDVRAAIHEHLVELLNHPCLVDDRAFPTPLTKPLL